MESQVQKAQEVSRSELDTAVDVSRSTGWMVVPSVPTAPWGYELWAPDGKGPWGINSKFPVIVDLPEDGERHSHDGAS